MQWVEGKCKDCKFENLQFSDVRKKEVNIVGCHGVREGGGRSELSAHRVHAFARPRAPRCHSRKDGWLRSSLCTNSSQDKLGFACWFHPKTHQPNTVNREHIEFFRPPPQPSALSPPSQTRPTITTSFFWTLDTRPATGTHHVFDPFSPHPHLPSHTRDTSSNTTTSSFWKPRITSSNKKHQVFQWMFFI